MNRTAQDEIFEYVEGVRQALGGLPAATREELLEDLPEHLAEVLAEGGGTLVTRLGSPSAYAAELIASAGLAGDAPRPPRTHRFAQMRAQASARVQRADVRFGPILGYAKASDFLVLLRPAWWVLRGYLAAMALAHIFDNNGAPLGLLPRIGGNELLALLFLGAAVIGSIWLGRRGEPAGRAPRLLFRGATVALAIFALVGFFETDGYTRQTPYIDAGYVSDYNGVQDIFVYDGQGNLVRNAQLFDQNGSKIEVGEPGCFDELTGNWTSARSLGYPYCPEQAPFQGNLPSEQSPTEPAASPSASAGPTDGSASPQPSSSRE